jgi:protein arginine kinase activator
VRCDDCGEKHATIRFVEMVDGELIQRQLCEECAAARGVGGSLSSLAGPLVGILMGLLEEAAGEVGPRRESEDRACPSCGATFADFRRAGRLGCGACYETFREELLPLIRRIHGSTKHAGRAPGSEHDPPPRAEIARLMAELAAAVREEAYERAAVIRDRVRALESSDGDRDVDVRDHDE